MSTAPADANPTACVRGTPSTREGLRAWYVLLLLHVAYVLSFVDRTILNMLVTAIKADLQLGDTEISLLMGAAFSVFYVVAGIPIARLADTRSRRNVIIAGILAWSVMTAGTGLAASFAMLLALRIGVAVGEAALSPSAISMLGDLFAEKTLSIAIALYSAAVFVGMGLALMLGGALIDRLSLHGDISLPLVGALEPWQAVFLIAGMPGPILVLLMLFTLQEPPRKDATTFSRQVTLPRFRDFLAHLGRHLSVYAKLFVAASMFSLMGYALSSWLPTYFVRHFGLSNAEIGAKLGLGLMLGGAAGVVAGGLAASWIYARRKDAISVIGMIAAVGSLIFGGAMLLASDSDRAFALTLPTYFFKTLVTAVTYSSLLMITPSRMHAQVVAVLLFVDSFIGLGLGPTVIALLTDFVFRDEALIGHSMMAVVVISMIAAFLLYLTLGRSYRTLVHDL